MFGTRATGTKWLWLFLESACLAESASSQNSGVVGQALVSARREARLM
jgi:hypothetical protein